jgi:prevent-host-death family protein
MEMAVSDAKAVLTDLIRRAEAGEEVVLTRHGRPVAHIVAIRARPDLGGRRAALLALMEEKLDRVPEGPDAARSQDHLYDEHGLPA